MSITPMARKQPSQATALWEILVEDPLTGSDIYTAFRRRSDFLLVIRLAGSAFDAVTDVEADDDVTVVFEKPLVGSDGRRRVNVPEAISLVEHETGLKEPGILRRLVRILLMVIAKLIEVAGVRDCDLVQALRIPIDDLMYLQGSWLYDLITTDSVS
jgi:hypothetical protein